jgi:hypothetical protein
MQDSDPEETLSENLEAEPRIEGHPLLRFQTTNPQPNHWTRYATIRHSDLVLFSFRHFAIPEDLETPETSLESFNTPGGIPQAANDLSIILLHTTHGVTITINGVHELEAIWTRKPHVVSFDNDRPVRARIIFRTYIRPRDWQVVRELTCITASQPAIKKLFRIAGRVSLGGSSDGIVHRCPCLLTDAQCLRSLTSRTSTTSAAYRVVLCLQAPGHGDADAHLNWITWPQSGDEGAILDRFGSAMSSLHAGGSRLVPGLLYSGAMEDVAPGRSITSSLAPLLRLGSKIGKEGAILLKKPLSWPATCPTFCLMVFDNASFDDEPALAQKIIFVYRANDVYVVRHIGSRGGVVTKSDESAIATWTEILMGERAVDVLASM